MTKPPKFIYNPIWKILGILLFLYVIIGGLVTPLNPGITYITPDKAKAGEQITIKCKGYNSNYSSATTNYAWLKLDSNHLLAATNTKALDDNTLEVTFGLPLNFPVQTENAFATVITYNEKDGAALRPSALYITDLVQGEDPLWQSSFGVNLEAPKGIRFPFRSILDETIRNTFFHVALWLSMIVLLLIGLYHAIAYLIKKDLYHDRISASFNKVAIFYGILGLVTGSIWARFTWGTWWTTDIKLNMSAIAMLIYLAYLILRSSTLDFEKRARLSAVYSIFSFAILIPLIFVIPRLTDSLHPGNGGNPALGGEDLDNTLRMFFYPSIIALILIGSWVSTLLFRSDTLEDKLLQNEDNKE